MQPLHAVLLGHKQFYYTFGIMLLAIFNKWMAFWMNSSSFLMKLRLCISNIARLNLSHICEWIPRTWCNHMNTHLHDFMSQHLSSAIAKKNQCYVPFIVHWLQGKTSMHCIIYSNHNMQKYVGYTTSGKILLMYVLLNMAGCTPLGTATGGYNHIP